MLMVTRIHLYETHTHQFQVNEKYWQNQTKKRIFHLESNIFHTCLLLLYLYYYYYLFWHSFNSYLIRNDYYTDDDVSSRLSVKMVTIIIIIIQDNIVIFGLFSCWHVEFCFYYRIQKQNSSNGFNTNLYIIYII